MTLEDALQFYMDVDTYTTEELYNKWKDYGVDKDKQYIQKKKYAAKQRLIKAGLL